MGACYMTIRTLCVSKLAKFALVCLADLADDRERQVSSTGACNLDFDFNWAQVGVDSWQLRCTLLGSVCSIAIANWKERERERERYR